MIIPKFYEFGWNKHMICRKNYKNSKEKLEYLRTEYELWALWIDKFYNGEYGIFKIGGDAPRYALEDDLDFCLWERHYEKNYAKRDHFANHKARSEYIIKSLTKLFNNVYKYVLRPNRKDYDYDYDNDEGFNLDFEEMKEKMNTDRTYKQKWFKAAYDANDYIDKLLYNMNPKIVYPKDNYLYTRNIYPKSNKRKQSKKVSKKRKQSKKVSRKKNKSKRRY